MNEHFLYLMVEIGTIFFPFIFSFEKKVSFYRKWKYILPAIVLTAIPFIIWDHFYTSIGIWGFNERYTLGIELFSLPLEELLFFFTIPYACIFIYEYLNKTNPETPFFDRHKKVINIALAGIFLVLYFSFINKAYTSIICLALVILLGIHTFILKTGYMGKYWRFFLVMIIPFLIVNSILTGTGIPESVFWYDKETIMNLRIGTIPIEDLFYSLALMLINITLYEKFKIMFGKKPGVKDRSKIDYDTNEKQSKLKETDWIEPEKLSF